MARIKLPRRFNPSSPWKKIMKSKRRKRNPADAFHRRNLILPDGLAEKVSHWHGGQFTPTYSLSSTGDHSYVSQAMIKDAIDELSRIKRSGKSTQGGYAYKFPAKEWKELREIISELDMVLHYPSEFSTMAAFGEDEDAGYSHSRENPVIFGKRVTPKRKRGHMIFKGGRDYYVDGVSLKQAAKYLSKKVKVAESEGRRIPRGPHGISPSAAGAVLRFGPARKKRRVAKKRRVVAKARRRQPTIRPRAVAAPRPTRQQPRQDAWDFIGTAFGGK